MLVSSGVENHLRVVLSKDRLILCLSRTSAIIGTTSREGLFSASSSNASNILFSPCPSVIRRFGPHRVIWRHNSLPIEPPAPVTRMHFPFKASPIHSSWTRAGSRRRRSVISTSRRRETLTLPPINSKIPGIVRKRNSFRPAYICHQPYNSPRSRRDRNNHFIDVILFKNIVQIVQRSFDLDTIYFVLKFAGVVIQESTGSKLDCRFFCNSRTTSAPASPAPITRTLRIFPFLGWGARDSPARIRKAKRTSPTNMRDSKKSIPSTERGRPVKTPRIKSSIIMADTITDATDTATTITFNSFTLA